MKEYYSSYPLIQSNKITKEKFDLSNNGYVLIANNTSFNGKIVEKISNGSIELVIFISNYAEKDLIKKLLTEEYSNINYEIEIIVNNKCSLIFKEMFSDMDILIVRRFNSNGVIISETSFQDGELLQYDEIIYNLNNELVETRTFVGKNAWIIEKQSYVE
ncbi:hypothetical protein [Emticicia sp. 17c]|uniref:hypothetical protein n=1 Tax=Emticicia sp. 17c TaxID=3127704 RepID=UPI00301D7708